jgi:hypothetical protein
VNFPTSNQHRAIIRAVRAPLAASVLLAASVSCADTPPPQFNNQHGQARGAALPHARTFDVEENDDVVNVTPRLRVDPRGGFLVFDGSESQIRRYSPDGKLAWFAGRRGDGPGEFRSVTAVARLASGDIVAADRSGRLTFFDENARQVLRTSETRLARVEDLEVVDDSTLLISGVWEGRSDGPRLHVWNVTRDTLTHAFFAPASRQRNQAAAGVVGFVMTAMKGDTIAATFGSSDTIYYFTRDGRDAGRVPLSSQHFRPAPDAGPGRTLTDPRERAEWLSRFDIVADVDWLPNGGLLIAYQSIEPRAALGRRWHLLGQDRAGVRRFEVQNVSSLVLGTDPDSGTVFLVPHDAEAPSRWTAAQLPH